MTNHIEELFKAILEGKESGVETNVKLALEAKHEPQFILDEGMIAAMKKVGDLFENGDYFLPEMLISAIAMKTGLNILKPFLQEKDIQAAGKIVIGTVKGDLHDVGKNLVSLMLEGAGYEVIDLGTDVSPETFVKAVKEHKAQIVGFSALLTTTMPSMLETIEALNNAGLKDKVKVLVGGAPVTQKYADSIGADGFAEDASKAVKLVNKIINS